MAREYAKNWISMWTDEDFCAQPVFDKLLWNVLLGQPPTLLNYAGVQPLSYRRWRKAMRDVDQLPPAELIEAALDRMEDRGYVFRDEDTGELLIRSFIRRDEVAKQPVVLLSALRAVMFLESPKLAAVLLAELTDRIVAPEVKVTSEKGKRLSADLAAAMRAAVAHLSTLAEGYAEPLAEGSAKGSPEVLPKGLGKPLAEPSEIEPFAKGSAKGSVVVEVEVATSRSVVGHLGGTREANDETGMPARPGPSDEPPKSNTNDPEPPTRCKKHQGVDDVETDCGPCANFRKAHDRWTERDRRRRAQAESDRAHQAAELRAAAIAACELCDGDGYAGAGVCDHVDRAATNRAGVAAARAALLAKAGRDA